MEPNWGPPLTPQYDGAVKVREGVLHWAHRIVKRRFFTASKNIIQIEWFWNSDVESVIQISLTILQ